MTLEIYVASTFKSIKSKLSNNQLKITTYTDIIFAGMQEVEKFKELSGADKSAVLLNVLELIINNNLLPLNMSISLNMIIKSEIFQPIINIIVSACNGDISLKLEKFCLLHCFGK